MNAFEKMQQQIDAKDSRLILGLDPVPAQRDYNILLDMVVRAEPFVIGIKPNLAFYETDRQVLSDLMRAVSDEFPHLVRILDAKRGDIATTQQEYVIADIENFVPDIVTVNPYDCGAVAAVQPYLWRNDDICVFATLVSSAQNSENLPPDVYLKMAHNLRMMGKNRVGFVVGANKVQEIQAIRGFGSNKTWINSEHRPFKDTWVLAPGLSAQGGDISFAGHAGARTVYPMSRGLTNPEFYPAGINTIDKAAWHWRNQINRASR